MGMNDCCPIHILNYPLPSIEKHFLKQTWCHLNKYPGCFTQYLYKKKGLAVVMIDFVNMFVVEYLPSCAFFESTSSHFTTEFCDTMKVMIKGQPLI